MGQQQEQQQLRQLGRRTSTTTKATTFINFIKLISDKRIFLLQVFSHLIAQLGITYSVSKSDSKVVSQLNAAFHKNAWTLFAFQIGIILILAFVRMPPIIKFVLFSAFSISFGIQLSVFNKTKYEDLVNFSIVGTICIFITMALAGTLLSFFGINVGYAFGSGLLYLLLILIIVQLVAMYTKSYDLHIRAISGAGLFLFSLFIIYEKNHILQRNYDGDFITASMDYYLDIINTFYNVMNFKN